MSQLDFNEEMAAELEAVYSKRDILRRRALVHEALGAAPGDRVLDAGCGPGFYVAETLERVGPGGSVVGVDASAPMLGARRQALRGPRQRQLPRGRRHGPAGRGRRLRPRRCPYRCSSTSHDIPAALGRAAPRAAARAGACCSGTSTGPRSPGTPPTRPRMERFLRAWDDHLADPVAAAHARRRGCAPPASRTSRCRATPSPPTTSPTRPTRARCSRLMADYVGTDEAQEWAAEQRELQARGESYFACIQFCFTGTRRR